MMKLLSITILKISYIYRQQNNYEYANLYEEQANEFDQGFPQLSHLYNERFVNYARNQADIHLNLSPSQQADRLYSTGVYLIKTNDYNQALEKLLQAKELFEKHLSLNDFPDKFGKLYEKIALVYLQLKNYFQALVMWKKAIDIRTSFLQN
ncbi:unnamed protein product [Adineta steineri]|uniref:Tetratricopeptide repeat protein n=1 Tax=Adineta steineri TaxID=433720 RepID=A0A813SQH0_9BILA|nr:unnamed protein product [Adineta steineri]